MSDELTPCRSCGLVNEPGSDFCGRCGEYLSWAPTQFVSAVTVETAAAADEAVTTTPGGTEQQVGGAGPGPAPHDHDHDHDHDHEDENPYETAVHARPPRSNGAPPPDQASTIDLAAAAVVVDPPPTPPPPPPAVQEEEPAVAAIAEGPPPTGDASIVLDPVDPALGTAGVPAVEAGATLSFAATVRNESQIVDNYDLAVLGLPENWAVASPTQAFLVPLGSGRGESQQELQIDISPPREYRSTAGIWTFELIAMSRTTATVAARATAQFEVRPFQAWSLEVVPTVNTGRLKARYRVAVRNDGNAEQDLWLIAIEDSGKIKTRFAAGQVTVQPGEVGVDLMTLRPKFPLPTGRAREHRVGVDVLSTAPPAAEEALTVKEKLAAKAKAEGKKAAGGVKVGPRGVTLPRLPRMPNPFAKLSKLNAAGALARLRSGAGDAAGPITARQVVFRQKPIVPLWLIALLIVAAAAAYLIYILLPKKVDVPVLVGAPDSFVAEKRLRTDGLVLTQPVQRRVDPNAEAGSVVEQSPAAGSEVEKGDTVSIVVADGETKVSVPRLKDLTRVKADERLREDGLELGDTQPADAADNFVVRSQIPDAGLSVDRGTAVRVFLKKPETKKKGAGDAKKDGAGGAGGGAGGAKANIVIPPIDDMPVDEYVAALRKLKLKPKVERVLSTQPADTVIKVDPQPGEKAKKGATVNVMASNGSPPLAVETDGLVLLLDPAAGKEVGRIPAGEGMAVEPSYAPGGEMVVYRSDLKIIVAETAPGGKERTLYAGPDQLESPSVAPNGKTVAVIRREEGDGDLCFGRIDQRNIEHLCLPDDGWDLAGRISWRDDGKVLLVPGRRPEDPRVFGIRQYVARVPFTTNPELWSGRIATDIATPGKGVRAAQYSPGGTKLALISNLESSGFEVVFAAAKDLDLIDPQPTGSKACDVAWRPDGQELAVVQADDACAEPRGKVVRFAVGSPRETALVTDEGRNPTYKPLK